MRALIFDRLESPGRSALHAFCGADQRHGRHQPRHSEAELNYQKCLNSRMNDYPQILFLIGSTTNETISRRSPCFLIHSFQRPGTIGFKIKFFVLLKNRQIATRLHSQTLAMTDQVMCHFISRKHGEWPGCQEAVRPTRANRFFHHELHEGCINRVRIRPVKYRLIFRAQRHPHRSYSAKAFSPKARSKARMTPPK